jgi:1,4-dihydroxy-2-naphthoate octaprenyltransferase
MQEAPQNATADQPPVTFKDQLTAWLTLSRLPFQSVGILPCVLGTVIAWRGGYAIHWGIVALAILAVACIMAATYLSGEYYDYSTDSANTSYNRFTGGSRVLQKGLVSRRRVLPAAIVALSLAGAIGLVIQFVFKTGPFTIPLGMLGMLCGFFYSSNPFRWAYRGVGEMLIFVCYGWLTVNTAYYLQTGRFDLVPTLVSIPIGISIFLVIFINEFPDYNSDQGAGKNNLVVRLGLERASVLYSILAGACFVSIPLSVIGGVPHLMLVLSPLALVPIGWNVVALARKQYLRAKHLERICALTLILNLGTTLLFIIAFALEK